MARYFFLLPIVSLLPAFSLVGPWRRISYCRGQRLFVLLHQTQGSHKSSNTSNDLLTELEEMTASVLTIETVSHAEDLLAQIMARAPNDNDSALLLRAHNALLQIYAVSNDDGYLERLVELLGRMVDKDEAPAPNDESYAWLLQAHVRRHDWSGAKEVWESLVSFQEQQPALTLLSPRLWEWHRRIMAQQEQ